MRQKEKEKKDYDQKCFCLAFICLILTSHASTMLDFVRISVNNLKETLVKKHY